MPYDFDEYLEKLKNRPNEITANLDDLSKIDDIRGLHEETLLHFCVIESMADCVKRLLEMGANPNVRSKYGSTPLMDAAALGHETIVALLLKAGADISAQDNSGFTVIENLALLKKHDNIREMILSYKRESKD